MPLTRCTDLFGNTTLLDADPMIETYTDVLCVPAGIEGVPSGVYDRGRKLVTAAGYFRASPDPVPLGSPFTTLDATRFDFADDGFTYLFLGTLTAHFGHFILASMARLWPLRFAPDPRLRYVVLNPAPLDPLFDTAFLREILGRLGIGPHNMVSFGGPVRIARLIVPSPAIEEHNFSHRVFAQLCNRIGALLTDRLPQAPRAAPVFLSKLKVGGGVSHLANEAEFCDRLAARGVEIVFPEQLDLAEQIRLFRDTAMITGWAGSAMHSAIFAPGRDMLTLSFSPTMLSNQRLLDQVNDARSLTLFPEGDMLPGPAHPGFHHSFVLRDPVRTADEFLAEIDATLRPAVAARGNAANGSAGSGSAGDAAGAAGRDGGGRVLFEHLFTLAPPILTEGESGWSEPEPNHTWTQGPASTLTLPRPDTDKAVRLELGLATILLAPHLLSRPLTVSVNGADVRSFTVRRSGEYSCVLPESCLSGERLSLRFSHPLTMSPRDLGLSEDSRPMSIAFSFIRLREADAG